MSFACLKSTFLYASLIVSAPSDCPQAFLLTVPQPGTPRDVVYIPSMVLTYMPGCAGSMFISSAQPSMGVLCTAMTHTV